MMTHKDVDKEVEQELAKFYERTFPEIMPKGITEAFKRALQVVPPALGRYNAAHAKKLVNIHPSEWSYIQVALVMNLVVLAKPSELHETLEEQLDFTDAITKLQDVWNEHVVTERNRLNKKAGIKKGILHQTGMMQYVSKNGLSINK